MKIGFIGTGNMARAFIRGIIACGHTGAQDIYCYDTNAGRLERFASNTGVTPCASNEELIELADVVVLAVKPVILSDLLPQLKDQLVRHSPLVVSIAAGTPIARLESLLDSAQLPIARVMPNVNATIGESISALCGNAHVSEDQLSFVKGMLEAVGSAVVLPEKDFTTFTAIASSSPAFAFLFIDALGRGAVKNGLPKDLATQIAAKAVLGSAKMILEHGDSPWNLIDMVCSPGGTTIAGLMALEDEAFLSLVVKCIDATIARDREMAQEG